MHNRTYNHDIANHRLLKTEGSIPLYGYKYRYLPYNYLPYTNVTYLLINTRIVLPFEAAIPHCSETFVPAFITFTRQSISLMVYLEKNLTSGILVQQRREIGVENLQKKWNIE